MLYLVPHLIAPEARSESDMDSSQKLLGKRLRKAREDKGLTQKDLAKLVDMSVPMLSRIETGRALTTKYLASLADCLDVSADWLTGSAPEGASDGLPVLDWDLTTVLGAVPLALAQVFEDSEARRPVGGRYALTVPGSAMAPAFQPGDTLIVESVSDWHPDDREGYVVTVHDGRAAVRAIVRDGATTWFAAPHSAFLAHVAGEETRVVGVVRALYRRL